MTTRWPLWLTWLTLTKKKDDMMAKSQQGDAVALAKAEKDV